MTEETEVTAAAPVDISCLRHWAVARYHGHHAPELICTGRHDIIMLTLHHNVVTRFLTSDQASCLKDRGPTEVDQYSQSELLPGQLP